MPQLPNDEKIWEALEVCRPDRDESPDPAQARLIQELGDLPELRRRYESIREFDAQLGELFGDVPAPQGLAEKIKNRLVPEGAIIPDADPAEGSAPKPEATPSVLQWSATLADSGEVRPRRRAVSRRWFFVAGGLSLVGAAAILIALFAGFGKTKPYELDTACYDAIYFFEQDKAKQGALLEEKPSDFPFSRMVIERPGIRWRKISNFLGGEGIAFDISAPGGGRATLYVTTISIPGASSMPSLNLCTTSGCAASVWQEDGRLYVLVVEGGKSDLNRLLRQQSPLA
jgi:hypothetical protein